MSRNLEIFRKREAKAESVDLSTRFSKSIPALSSGFLLLISAAL